MLCKSTWGFYFMFNLKMKKYGSHMKWWGGCEWLWSDGRNGGEGWPNLVKAGVVGDGNDKCTNFGCVNCKDMWLEEAMAWVWGEKRRIKWKKNKKGKEKGNERREQRSM